MRRRITLTIALCLIAFANALYAQIDTETRNYTVSIAGENKNSTTALTAVEPIAQINGHAEIFISRQTANDKVVAESVSAEIVGSLGFLEIFIEADRNIDRGIELETKIGYFAKTPALQLGPFSIEGGAGNTTSRQQVKDALQIDDAGAIGFNWISYAQVRFWKIETTLTAEPTFDLREIELELDSAIVHDLDENVAVGITAKSIFASHPPTGDKTHNQYMIFARWTR